jgi:prevent-host-death family protein
MQTVNIRAARTHLSRLVEQVGRGESVVIAKAGLPVARLVPVQPEAAVAGVPRRLGFMSGQGCVPDDFDRMCSDDTHMLAEYPGPIL